MKRFTLLFFSLFVFSMTTFAQQSGPSIKFDKLVHDFGAIVQGDNAEYEFHFINNGNAPLIISNVRSTCGCTVPTWPHDPVMPGQEGKIKVHYDSNRVGEINKQITVESNSATGQVYLKIIGTISKKPSEVIPFQNYDPSGFPGAN